MKKIILTIAFIASGMVASAQVGIGNEDPKVTLQVDASGTDADGVLVPRVSVDALNAKDAKYVAAQNGALVFVNDLTGTAAGKTIDVVATGFYYYSAGTVNKWVAVAGAVQQYQNIRGGVETITGAGPVSNNSYFVIFNAAASGDIILPTPALGKIFWLKNSSPSGVNANVLNVIGGTGINTGAFQITSGKMRSFISNGVNWYVSNQ